MVKKACFPPFFVRQRCLTYWVAARQRRLTYWVAARQRRLTYWAAVRQRRLTYWWDRPSVLVDGRAF
ncbi:MAG TPA: hypothetical protein PLZ55_07955 [bacterium]|nr:hypothetical protein [bacterium]